MFVLHIWRYKKTFKLSKILLDLPIDNQNIA